MGRFPWVAGHSKQESDKSQYLPHELLTRPTVEPSRQALNQLRKDVEDGGEISPATSPKSRSRSGTVSSTLSFYAKSSSDRSNDGQTRPPSRQSIVPELARDSTPTENVARNLFSKGSRMIRRQGSKLTLGTPQIEHGRIASAFLDSDEPSLSKRGSSKSSYHRFPQAGSPKGSDIRANISGPYGFQHLSHTDQGHFQSLNKVSKLDLVQEFTAVQDGQAPAGEIQGIAVSDLPPLTQISAGTVVTPPLSPTSSIMPEHPDLPTTPPRPTPPPKEGLPPPPKTPDIRLSRSVENFSRLTRSPMVTEFEFPPVPGHTTPLMDESSVSALDTVPQSPSGWAEEIVDQLTTVAASRRHSMAAAQLLEKPLPLPPAVIHAVSTNDESAVPLRTAPLPELPTIHYAAAEGMCAPTKDDVRPQRPQMPHRVSLRHAQSFPTAKLLRRRSQSSGDVPFASSFGVLGYYAPNPNKTKRISIGIKKIDIEDWEDAIDYAWDHPLDMEDVGVPAFDPPITAQSLPSRPESLLVVRQSPSEPMTQPSTTLTMRSPVPNKPLPTPKHSKRLSSLHHPASKLSLQGLGIASTGPQGQVFDQAAQYYRGSKRESFVMPQSVPTIPAIRREPGSPISKSSSQESIILSIASSIMGTHRSSNSSTSLGDLSNLASIEDENECDNPRDESPPTTDDSITPPGSATARPSDASNQSGNTSDGSHETVKTDIAPSSAPDYAPPPPPTEQTPLSLKRHGRTTSISRANVPNRTSSIAAPTIMKGPTTRARSNTLTNRSRYNLSRASYSLFPSAQPTTSQAPITPTP